MDMALGTVPVDNPTSTETFTITPITIPNSVKTIGQGCFYFDTYTLSSMGYPNVKIVNLSNGLENVGDGGFGIIIAVMGPFCCHRTRHFP